MLLRLLQYRYIARFFPLFLEEKIQRNMRRAASVTLAAAPFASVLLLDQGQKRYGLPLALCEHPKAEDTPEERLKQWLQNRGCQVDNIEIKPSTVSTDQTKPCCSLKRHALD